MDGAGEGAEAGVAGRSAGTATGAAGVLTSALVSKADQSCAAAFVTSASSRVSFAQ